jgi:hypothetical protein
MNPDFDQSVEIAAAASPSPRRLRAPARLQLATFGPQNYEALHAPTGEISVRLCAHWWAVIDWPAIRLEHVGEER